MAFISNFSLTNATLDVYYSKTGGLFRPNYEHLISELTELTVLASLSEYDRHNVVHPLLKYLLDLKEERFREIFSKHLDDLTRTTHKRIQSYLPLIAEALLQRNHEKHYDKSAFDDLLAFQAIVNDIYKIAINHMSTTIPPLVTWSRKHEGPFTIHESDIKKTFNIGIGVVCLPPEYRTRGLFAWSVMGHEVTGHNLINSKPGFLQRLTAIVKEGIKDRLTHKLERENIDISQKHLQYLSDYWSMPQRIEELASDVLGILSTGPSLALGTIGYFRGVSQDFLLKTTGPFDADNRERLLDLYVLEKPIRLRDISSKVKFEKPKGVLGKNEENLKVEYESYKPNKHPIEVLRPFAMAEAIKHTFLDEDSKNAWIQLIIDEIVSKEFSQEKDIKIIKVKRKHFPPQKKEVTIPFKVASLSAEAVAEIITTAKFQELGDQKITDVFNWSMDDERLVDLIRNSYQDNISNLPSETSSKHIVAAAVIEASTSNANVEFLFQAMKKYLIKLHHRL